MILKIGKKVVGKIENGEYISTRKRRKHYFRKYRGWGISQKIIDYLEAHGIDKIKLIVDKTDVFTTDLNTIKKSKIVEYTDKQYILPQSQWASITEKPKQKKVEQTRLF